MFSWIKRHENSESEIWSTWRILADLEQRFPGVWLPQAAACRTLLPHSRPLTELSLPQAMNDFILRYEPKAKSGIYEHQAQILVAACQTTAHLILTSGTGSGKSLCFLSFVLEALSRSLQTTALICLPTQALLWGQAERLAALSTDCSYNHAGQAMAGRLVVAGQPICWTIWKGSQDDAQMQRHQGTSAFGRARLRLATIDKVHFSLLREGAFFRQLAVMVLDEAHQYQGIFGAQTAYLMKRIAVLKEVFSLSPVRFFLASATLPQPIDFASRLLSVPKSAIIHIDGSATETVEFISLAAAKSFLKQREAALKRLVLFYDRQPGRPELTSLLTAKPLRHSRALYFCQSKAMSRRLRFLLKPHLAQPVLLYDADLLPEERRELEQTFRHHVERPLLLIATNALELGVDIGGLDVCLLPNLTLGQAAFQQRLGRVGRAVTRPGLVIAGLGVSPWEAALKQHLTALFLPRQTPLPLPLALPALKERSLLLAGSEKDLQSAAFTVRVKPQRWRAACQRIYGCEPTECEDQAKAARMSRRLYDGFRGPQERKVELIANGTKEPIAFMARHCLLARGHAGAIYIDELSHFWQVLPASFQQKPEGATGSYPFASALVDRLLLAPLAERAYITAGIVHGQVRFVRPLADP
ncbi:MAG: DEAD/DEAH box helicase, partial [Sporomusaceae bacterium]|nr:DEAD/DEAH box helicase [Sporomusaceae bacterium]